MNREQLDLIMVPLILVCVFLVAWGLWASLAKPFFIERTEAALMRCRDEFFWQVHAKAPGCGSKSALALSRGFELVDCLNHLRGSWIVWELLFRRSELKTAGKRETMIFQEAPIWIRDIRERQSFLLLRAVLINSPWFLVFVVAWISFGLFRWKVRQHFEELSEAIPDVAPRNCHLRERTA